MLKKTPALIGIDVSFLNKEKYFTIQTVAVLPLF